MDMDYLRNRRRIESQLAAEATCPKARAAHKEMADHYGRLIGQERGLFIPFAAQR